MKFRYQIVLETLLLMPIGFRDRTSKGALKKSTRQLLQPCWLYASSALSLAIALAMAPVRAEEKHPTHDDRTSNIETFESDTARIDPIFAPRSARPTKTLKQARLLPKSSTEPAIESSNFEFAAPALLPDPIAQADVPPPPPVESQPPESPPAEPQPAESAPANSQPPESAPAGSQPAESQPAEPTSEPSSSETSSDRWQFSVEPYFFVPLNVQVNASVLGRSASIDLGLGDILSLDRAFDAGVRVEARKNRWGIIFDGFYISVGNSGNIGVTFPEGSLTQFGVNFPVTASTDADLSVRQGTIDLAASYRVVDTLLNNSATSSNPFPRLTVDPILGMRINILSQKLEVDNISLNNIPINNLPLPSTISANQEFSFNRTFVEPLIGAQIRLDLSKRWALGLRGDVSGFGIGAERNTTWNLLVSSEYAFSPSTSLRLGYRFNDFDFEDGEGLKRARVNLSQNGLMLGVIFRF